MTIDFKNSVLHKALLTDPFIDYRDLRVTVENRKSGEAWSRQIIFKLYEPDRSTKAWEELGQMILPFIKDGYKKE